jgi:hypothetical protein
LRVNSGEIVCVVRARLAWATTNFLAALTMTVSGVIASDA